MTTTWTHSDALTPGPWELEPAKSGFNQMVNSQPDASGEAAAIAEVYSNEADALLIACAPELLDAAKNYFTELNKSAEKAFGPEHLEEMRRLEFEAFGETPLFKARIALEAAIAKAEGTS